MDGTLVPGGRWVRVRMPGGTSSEFQGRWHLAMDDPRFRFSIASRSAVVACGRTMTAGDQAATLAISDELPRAHVCSICSERYVRDRLFEIRVHNLTTSAPA